MTEETKEWMIAQAYCGFITFIINVIFLWFFIGNIKTANSNTKIVVHLAMLVVISSIIYCFSSSIIMSDAIFGIRLNDEICEFAFRWTYAFWTIQRYFVYLFFIYRLKTIFQNSPLAVSNGCIFTFLISVRYFLYIFYSLSIYDRMSWILQLIQIRIAQIVQIIQCWNARFIIIVDVYISNESII